MGRAFCATQMLDRWMQLPGQERWLVAEACFFLACAKLAIVTTPARTLLALGNLDLTRETVPEGRTELPGEIDSVVAALDKSSRRLFFANCLVRAIALRMLLARRNIATELHIGARKDEGQFTAHAWLTFQEKVLVGGDDAKDLYRELVGSSHALLQ